MPRQRQKISGSGNRRALNRNVDPRSVGWNATIREKVSKYASEYAYEVRLPHAFRWPHSADPQPYTELVEALRRSSDCRIVGLGPWSGVENGRKVWSVRVYLRTEADLMNMRLLTNDVFRVYKLTSA